MRVYPRLPSPLVQVGTFVGGGKTVVAAGIPLATTGSLRAESQSCAEQLKWHAGM